MLRAWATVQGTQFLQQVHSKETEKANFRCSPTECPARTWSKPEWHSPTMKKAKLCFSSKIFQGTVCCTLLEYCGNRELGPRGCTTLQAPVSRRLRFAAVVSGAPLSLRGGRNPRDCVFSDAPAGPGVAPRAARRSHRARCLLRPPPAPRRVCGPRPRGSRRRLRRRKPPALAPSGHPGPRPLA